MFSTVSQAQYVPYAQQPTASPSYTLTRQEKTNQLLGEVLPTSLGLGLQALGSSGTAAIGSSATSAVLAGAGSTLGTVGTGSTIFGGIMGAMSLAMNWGRSTPAAGATSGTMLGASVGTMICPGIGTAIGAALGAIGGGLIGSIKTGKPADQRQRDQVRAVLVQNGILDSKYCLTLADGSKYDMGIDGPARAELGGRRAFDLDAANPMTKYAVSWLNPLMDLMSGGNQKLKIEFMGYFANAALTNAKSLDDLKKNVGVIMAKFGVSDEALYRAISSAAQGGQLDRQTSMAYVGGMRERLDPNFTGNLSPVAPQTVAEEVPAAA